MKRISAYLIASAILFLVLLLPSLWGIYEWQYALIFTIGGVLADIVARRFILPQKPSNNTNKA